MTLIVCVDNSCGMAFNCRRVSRDREVTARIAVLAGQDGLWLNSYTAKLFDRPEALPPMHISDDFLAEAGDGDLCFAENTDVSPYAGRIDRVLLFRWNRDYPSDLKFSMPLDDGCWTLRSSEEFAGRSHERITMEVYDRCRQ